MAGRRTTFRELLRRWQVARERRRVENDAWRKRLAAEELKRAENGGFSSTNSGGAF
jgi:hypothetical protein